MQAVVDDSLESSFATPSPPNLTLSLEANALAAISRNRWPSDLGSRVDFIKSNLAKTESALIKISGLLTELEDQKFHMLKAEIGRLLQERLYG